VIAIYVTNTGATYTTAPTVMSAGTGSNLAATAYLHEWAMPMIAAKPVTGVYTLYRPQVIGGTLNCNGVADGIEFRGGKETDIVGTMIHHAKYDGIRYLGTDISSDYSLHTYDSDSMACILATIGIRQTHQTRANEHSSFNYVSKLSGQAEIYASTWANSGRWYGGTLLSDTGIHAILGGVTAGHSFYGVKAEHYPSNTKRQL